MASQEQLNLAAGLLAYADIDESFRALGQVTLKEALMYIEHTKGVSHFSDYYEGDGKFAKGFEEMANWTIVSSVNKNGVGQSGFVGFIFDTGNNERVVSLRGSETIGTPDGTTDWQHDLDYLNSTLTSQEADLQEFLDYNSDLLNEGSWRTTGHSLGGALADHAAIYSAESSKLDPNNFIEGSNFDGPGHSKEYIEFHKEAISVSASKMKHYRASFVGSILNNIPGVEQIFVESKGFKLGNHMPAGNWCGLDDSEGNLVRRNIEPWEKAIQQVTVEADSVPAFIGNALAAYLKDAFLYIEYIKTARNKFNAEKIPHYIAAGIFQLLVHPVETIPNVAHVITTVGVVIALVLLVFRDIAIQYVIDGIVHIAKKIAELVCDAVDWLKGKVDELCQAIQNAFNDFQKMFRETFNRGVSYVRSNPYFSADTDKLRNYAFRLKRVNTRLGELDRGLKSLVKQVRLKDVADILELNLITCRSLSLAYAANYLNNTANRLENADNKAKSYMGG